MEGDGDVTVDGAAGAAGVGDRTLWVGSGRAKVSCEGSGDDKVAFGAAVGDGSDPFILPLTTPSGPASRFQASRPPISRTGTRRKGCVYSLSNIAWTRLDTAGV